MYFCSRHIFKKKKKRKEKKERRKKNTCQTSSIAAKFMLVSSVESNVKVVPVYLLKTQFRFILRHYVVREFIKHDGKAP